MVNQLQDVFVDDWDFFTGESLQGEPWFASIEPEGQYDSVDDVDPWIGGLAEDHLPGASVGPTVCLALRDQFTRLRDGDPFFHLNDPDLDPKKIRSIIDLSKLTLANVIRWNTSIRSLPENVFLVSEQKQK